jgi:hypothetical protein
VASQIGWRKIPHAAECSAGGKNRRCYSTYPQEPLHIKYLDSLHPHRGGSALPVRLGLVVTARRVWKLQFIPTVTDRGGGTFWPHANFVTVAKTSTVFVTVTVDSAYQRDCGEHRADEHEVT